MEVGANRNMTGFMASVTGVLSAKSSFKLILGTVAPASKYAAMVLTVGPACFFEGRPAFLAAPVLDVAARTKSFLAVSIDDFKRRMAARDIAIKSV